MTSYLARLKALNSEKRSSNELTEPTKRVSSVLSASTVAASEKRAALSSVLSVSELGASVKTKAFSVDFFSSSGRRYPDEVKVEHAKKALTKGADKTDDSRPHWRVRAGALVASGLPHEWAEPFARLLCSPPTGDFDRVYWARILPGANVFADEWAARAHALGWTAEEVFGLDDIKPAARHDRKGVAWLLGDCARVVALDERGADIMTKQGSRQRFYRRLSGANPQRPGGLPQE